MNPILSRRTRVRSSSDNALSVSPSIAISPLVGLSKPPMRLRRVDLPEPDGPTIATISDFAISREMLSRAVALRFPSKVFETPVSVIIRSLMVQEQINHDTCHRNVHPYRKRPFRNPHVVLKASFERKINSAQHDR